jgi:2-dehydropantoate 2-reductase
MNYMLMQMVKGKTGMISREVGEGVPFVQPRNDKGEGAVSIKDRVAEKERDGGEM